MAIYNRSEHTTHPPRSGKWWLLPLFFGIAIPFGGFAALAEDVSTHDVIGWDVPILNAVHSYATPLLDRFFTLIAAAGYRGVLLVDLLIALLFIYRRQLRTALFWTVATGGAALLDSVMKFFFHRTRPILWLEPNRPTSYSFPSGHAMVSLAFVATLVVLLWGRRWRWLALLLGALFVFLVGLSRIYLGVHYPSDVLAGWAVSFIWVTGVSLVLGGRSARVTPHAQSAT